ncbi:legumain-like [Antedon mediterranea]|uniref:legumain-like n=1 Tax=Antedon mediterranea TaxID=105859 RepID=UPI003AF5C798
MKNWALLVAGTREWHNYRHQANVCHAYQILHRNCIPDEQIVVMMFDDIADNVENKYDGVIINHPDGTNLYKGVPKDYTGLDVTPTNFLNILQGKKSEMACIGSGKVIDSGPEDNVFVYYTGDGESGSISFPYQEWLKKSELNEALTYMHKAMKYAKMLFYLDADFGDSMFANLSSSINVFATAPTVRQYAFYYNSTLHAYLGTLYGVSWMEDSDTNDLGQETLDHQFDIMRKRMYNRRAKKFRTEKFGDEKMGHLKVGDFQGHAGKSLPCVVSTDHEVMPSHEIPMAILYRKLSKATSVEQSEGIQEEIQKKFAAMKQNAKSN